MFELACANNIICNSLRVIMCLFQLLLKLSVFCIICINLCLNLQECTSHYSLRHTFWDVCSCVICLLSFILMCYNFFTICFANLDQHRKSSVSIYNWHFHLFPQVQMVIAYSIISLSSLELSSTSDVFLPTYNVEWLYYRAIPFFASNDITNWCRKKSS